MISKFHTVSFDSDGNILHIVSNAVLIQKEQDILDLMGETEFKSLVLHDYNFDRDFFDLSTRKLGDVLQKLTNYRVKLAVIGDFSKYPSKTLLDFIRESNKHGEYLFLKSLDEVKKIWKLL